MKFAITRMFFPFLATTFLGTLSISKNPENPILMNHPSNWTHEWYIFIFSFIGVMLLGIFLYKYLEGDYDNKNKYQRYHHKHYRYDK